MSSSVFQGLQSCLEPWLFDPQVIRLKLVPPSSKLPQSLGPPLFNPASENNSLNEETQNNIIKSDRNTFDDFSNAASENDYRGGWSFLQAITNTPPISKEGNESAKAEYVHPMVKRSTSVLGEKSLEMCTESLGSETGSTISESCNEFSCLLSDNEKYRSRKLRGLSSAAKKLISPPTFPPPLTTINGVRVKGCRENGRLVIKAISVKSSKSCFKAERRDGRLRLRFVKDFAERVYEDESHLNEEDLENPEGDDDMSSDHEEEEEEEEMDGCKEEDMEGISGNVGDEMGVAVGDLSGKPSRCKEGGGTNEEMLAWGNFWVASS
ncbi:hypothetical protein Nepgr_004523 [Nepenthes gracilis]|uniref:FAF domain-containing protein n=1 Tax=Nepenthes gracilis TaxID=150966 RepID=A0AAD3XF84_NEPGR|nr:hypothetical protein Nepgr_004523 [Nepenthes gracilis]